MLGLWIRPWKGEWVCGEVIAVSGADLVCRTLEGMVFRFPMGELAKAETLSRPPYRRRQNTPPAGYQLTAKGMSA
jgi:hypothetical protein